VHVALKTGEIFGFKEIDFPKNLKRLPKIISQVL
jgi:hypothetical protein